MEWIVVMSFGVPPVTDEAFEAQLLDNVERLRGEAAALGFAPSEHVRLERDDVEIRIAVSQDFDAKNYGMPEVWRAE